MERKGDFISTTIRYKKETEVVTFQGREIAGAVAGIFARLCIRGKLRADVACGVGREGDEVAAVQ